MQKAILVTAGLLLGVAGAWLVSTFGNRVTVDAAAAARGESLYRVCAACHGAKGEGNVDTGAPLLAGQYGWYLETQLRNFRAGVRGADSADVNGGVMRPMALGLPNDAAVSDVVAYIQTLRP